MSNFESALSALAKRVEEHSETIQTEEAVKTSVILPFLQALGYDVFNPAEVVPEFNADAVGKKGEKVDYAIQIDGDIAVLVECKGLATSLNEKHLSQLFRYFTVTNARFAVLTNGREYRFFSDLDEPNKLDKRPFFTFDLLDYSSAGLNELSKFSKPSFDVSNILEQAERLKYVSAIKGVMTDWMESPPEGLVKLISADVYDGRLNANARAMLASGIVSAFKEIVRDRLRQRLSSALEDNSSDAAEYSAPEKAEEINTTPEEIEGWLLVKALLRGTIDVDRVFMRDAKSYCAILLDDNNRKPLARLHFNRARKYVGFFDGDAEERLEIEGLDDLMKHQGRLTAAAVKYS
jgi:hypothetical protein